MGLYVVAAFVIGTLFGWHLERRSWLRLFEQYLAAKPDKAPLGFVDAQGAEDNGSVQVGM